MNIKDFKGKKLLDHITNYVHEREYMSGVERDNLRVKATGEVFTPTPLVQEMLEKIPVKMFKGKTKTFLDPSCGDGQFLAEVLIRKIENGSTFEQALSTIYGVDIMQDNINLCRERLLCGFEEYRHIVNRNIVCADALTYDFSFEQVETDGVFEYAPSTTATVKEKSKGKKKTDLLEPIWLWG